MHSINYDNYDVAIPSTRLKILNFKLKIKRKGQGVRL